VKSADSIVGQSAAHALGQLQAKEAVHELIALLNDEDADVRKSAACPLTELQAKEAVHELIALLNDETYGSRKRFRLKEASNTINKDNNFNYYVFCCNYPVTWLFVSTYYTHMWLIISITEKSHIFLSNLTVG
jgi:hypothetical protein